MVGAGALIKPLLGWEHWHGVCAVGAVVMVIVATAGMVSTTWVQFIKGAARAALHHADHHDPRARPYTVRGASTGRARDRGRRAPPRCCPRPRRLGRQTLCAPARKATAASRCAQGRPRRPRGRPATETRPWVTADHKALTNGKEAAQVCCRSASSPPCPMAQQSTGALGPLEFFRVFSDSTVVSGARRRTRSAPAATTPPSTIQLISSGATSSPPAAARPSAGLRSDKPGDKIDFLSLMLALFCGTASLPHILIRYYTVKDQASARKSTILGIACHRLLLRPDALSGPGRDDQRHPRSSQRTNMAAPLLAKSFNAFLFAVISAIAFTTVLGTVSGLIMAAAAAVAHDLPRASSSST